MTDKVGNGDEIGTEKDFLTNNNNNNIDGNMGKMQISSKGDSHSKESPSSEFNVWSAKIIACLVLWYFFSFTTLFLNKYILTNLNADPSTLGSFQLSMCIICGYFHLKIPIGLNTQPNKHLNEIRSQVKLSNFTRNLFIVGCFRFTTLVLGLVALWYVPVSFAETVKSTAPVFTVLISRMLLGERTTLMVNLSLIPVMAGLAICSAYELSFSLVGFVASLATNLSECFQNVFSKKLLSMERYEPAQIQFYTSASSLALQIPWLLMFVDLPKFYHHLFEDSNVMVSFILNGVSFHCQSICEYLLLSYLSPVTHSVANTTKRAVLIWLSVLIFGNPVTVQSWIGTAIVIFGVCVYNKARNIKSDKMYEKLKTQTIHDP